MNRDNIIWGIWIYSEYRNTEGCDLFSVKLAQQVLKSHGIQGRCLCHIANHW